MTPQPEFASEEPARRFLEELAKPKPNAGSPFARPYLRNPIGSGVNVVAVLGGAP